METELTSVRKSSILQKLEFALAVRKGVQELYRVQLSQVPGALGKSPGLVQAGESAEVVLVATVLLLPTTGGHDAV